MQQRETLELALILPRKIERKLREESERTGASVEEIALDALIKGMNERIDPLRGQSCTRGSPRSTSGTRRSS